METGNSPQALQSVPGFVPPSESLSFGHVQAGDDSRNRPFRWREIQSPISVQEEINPIMIQGLGDEPQSKRTRITHSISISMPCSPLEDHFPCMKQVPFSDYGSRFPIPRSEYGDSTAPRNVPFPKVSRIGCRQMMVKDKRFDLFKTWSGKLEQQLSNLRGKPQEDKPGDPIVQNKEVETLPVERYFDALHGPELDSLRASEEILLPGDEQWPFLLRFPISSFGICLGISSQAILWKAAATSPSMEFLRINLAINLFLWSISVALIAIVSSTYLLKVIFYFEAVRREYQHPVRVNFFFAPWISLLFLAIGAPQPIADNLGAVTWYFLMAPIFGLELKIYGQWMLGGQRKLSRVANPSNHLSVIGNFVGALLGASMGITELPLFFFAIGLAHYGVLFVTLYQRLPTNDTLPKELHPVFFLFVAAPSVASMALAKIQGSFDYNSRIAYFLALFLYVSLVVRVNFFRGFRFSLAWWAYTFPMTGLSIATITYANETRNLVTQSLCLVLFFGATVTVSTLLLTTIFHAFVLQDLFPNDIAIAISGRRPKTNKKRAQRQESSKTLKASEGSRKFATSNCNDNEASLRSTAN